MFSHVTVGASDIPRAVKFYDAIFAPLGITRYWGDESTQAVGWRRGDARPGFFVNKPFDGQTAATGNGCMSAFEAPSRDMVRMIWEIAIAHGGTDEGPPGLRPQYAPDYYGAYFRDPDGNKLHVVFRGA